MRVDSRHEISEIAASVFNSGSLAQLVEHFTFNEGVDGSNPSRATNLKLSRTFPSSSGLGHLPFTEDTGVQIPLGTPNPLTIPASLTLRLLIRISDLHIRFAAVFSEVFFSMLETISCPSTLNLNSIYKCLVIIYYLF